MPFTPIELQAIREQVEDATHLASGPFCICRCWPMI